MTKLAALAAPLLALPTPVLAHPGHGAAQPWHWHGTDSAGLLVLVVLASLALWLSRDR